MKRKEIWFITGSQHLYGPETLQQVADNARTVAKALHDTVDEGVDIVWKPTVTTPEEIYGTCRDASASAGCIGVIVWMHTFSPAKMWIRGLQILQKPLCHLHTQFNRDIPWSSIDMDFMNLNQSAHGGREFGHICTRLGIRRTVIVGHWQSDPVCRQLKSWARAAEACHELNGMKVVRFGDNMRQVAVTEGDKVSAEMQFGVSVNTHGVGDLVECIESIDETSVDSLCEDYEQQYAVVPELRKGGDQHESLCTAAKIELGLRHFLEEGGYSAFTDTFEDLHGLQQLPGLPVQRLMADGYGFGAEGDWKHAALVRAVKVMAGPNDPGTSFMEDYTYHFDPEGPRCLGAHMLEICPSIAVTQPSCEIHPLGIGGKADPVRLVFDGKPGEAVNVSLVDLGDRFRLLVSEVTAEVAETSMPKLPVARVLWDVKPDLATGAAAWIYAGGAHHTAFSYGVTADQLLDFAEMTGVECVVIDDQTRLRTFRQQLQ